MTIKTAKKIKKAESRQKETELKKIAPRERYFEAVGRRKTAIARVRIWPLKDRLEISVNDKPLEKYWSWKEFQEIFLAPLHKTSKVNWRISVKVKGGGLHAQAKAAQHGLSRALISADLSLRPTLKAHGFLTRDARMKERKKFGLKGARRAPQWSKR